MKIKSIVKLSNTFYHSLCTSGAFNFPTASLKPSFICDATNHGVNSFPHKKDKKNIAENKKKFIKMKESQGGGGGFKTRSKRSNKNFWTNKAHRQQNSDRKANIKGDTKSNNGFHLVDGK